MSKKNLAIYLRLSIDDTNSEESNSISNQRDLIHGFINQNQKLSTYNIVEYKDDGYTGTNLNRSGMKQLLYDIKANNISCVVVKDFSRFSRDYITLGNYIEQVFPFMGVRFISINDNYDSDEHSTSNIELDVPIKGLLYDLYSKDLSKKIKVGNKQAKINGKLYGGSHPFGYTKSKNLQSIYDIDSEAASIIKMIFDLSEEGNIAIEIARKLNINKIPTPATYKKNKGFFGYGIKEGKTPIWDSTKVNNILRDERYTGMLILGKYRSAGLGSGKVVSVKKEEWHCFDNKIPTIITKKQFLTVQNNLKPYVKKGKRQITHIYLKKIKCANCGRYLYHKPSHSGDIYNSFFCKIPHLDNQANCFTGYIKESFITKAVAEIIRVHASIAIDVSDKLKVLNNQNNSSLKNLSNLKRKYESEIAATKLSKSNLYKNFKEGNVSKEIYFSQKVMLSKKVLELEGKILEIGIDHDYKKSKYEFLDTLKKYHNIKKIDREVITLLVDIIEVNDKENITIILNYQDELNDLYSKISKIQSN